jgi:hypothetical protein
LSNKNYEENTIMSPFRKGHGWFQAQVLAYRWRHLNLFTSVPKAPSSGKVDAY